MSDDVTAALTVPHRPIQYQPFASGIEMNQSKTAAPNPECHANSPVLISNAAWNPLALPASPKRTTAAGYPLALRKTDAAIFSPDVMVSDPCMVPCEPFTASGTIEVAVAVPSGSSAAF